MAVFNTRYITTEEASSGLKIALAQALHDAELLEAFAQNHDGVMQITLRLVAWGSSVSLCSWPFTGERGVCREAQSFPNEIPLG